MSEQRPAEPSRTRKSCCWLTNDEHAAVVAAARADDRSVSAWLRIVALEEVSRLKRGPADA